MCCVVVLCCHGVVEFMCCVVVLCCHGVVELMCCVVVLWCLCCDRCCNCCCVVVLWCLWCHGVVSVCCVAAPTRCCRGDSSPTTIPTGKQLNLLEIPNQSNSVQKCTYNIIINVSFSYLAEECTIIKLKHCLKARANTCCLTTRLGPLQQYCTHTVLRRSIPLATWAGSKLRAQT